MNSFLKILNKIIPNIQSEVTLFKVHLKKLEVYEREKGKWFVKSHDASRKEKLVLDENKNQKKPEEIVRQLFLFELTDNYSYPIDKIKVEEKISFGREKKRSDIVVYQEDGITPWIIVEVKAPYEKLNIPQLKSYLNAEGSPIGVASNGKEMTILYRPYPKKFDDNLPDIPTYIEYLKVKDTDNPAIEVLDIVLSRNWTLKELEKKSMEKKKSLREIIELLEELVLANSGVDSFNEIFKLIYAKLYDEWDAKTRRNKELKFRKYKDPETTFNVISELFTGAKHEWKGIFEKNDSIKLTPEHLNVAVAEMQEIKLFGADLRIIDEAFEYLVPEVSKSKKGQYFTPRIIIDTAIKMLNPHKKEYVIDPACGSAGFLVHTMQYIWDKYNIKDREMKKDYAKKYLWGIDFEEKATKISKAIMLIAGDGKTHIYKENSLEFPRWSEKLKTDLIEEELVDDKILKELNFDIVLTNPPFAGDIKEEQILSLYHEILVREVVKINISDKLRKVIVEKMLSRTKTANGKNKYELLEDLINDLRNLKKDDENKFSLEKSLAMKLNNYGIDFDEVVFIDKKKNIIKINYNKIKLLKVNIKNYESEKNSIENLYENLKSLNKNTDDFSIEENRDKANELLREFNINVDDKILFIKKTKEPKDYAKVERHLLFIERAIDIIKPGGRLAIVLPQGVFNNTNQKYIREYILGKARILAVIGLHVNSFKPHTGTKTSLLFLRKWKEKELNKTTSHLIKDYPIFFAVSKISFKDNSGNYIFLKDENGNLVFDKKGDPIYQTDLFEITDAFIDWAKKRLEEGDNVFDFLM